MRTLPIKRPTLDDPLYSQRNPYQVFLLGLSIIGSIPLLRGYPASSVLASQLSHTAVIFWGTCLLIGSVVALAGEFWPGHTWDGLVIERAGLSLVGLAAAVYAVVVWTSVHGAGSDAATVAPWAFISATCAAAATAVWNAYLDPPTPPAPMLGRAAVATLTGFVVGAYAGAVWNLAPTSSGVVYVVSIQAAYALSCTWRAVQITRRLRWIHGILDELEQPAATAGDGRE